MKVFLKSFAFPNVRNHVTTIPKILSLKPFLQPTNLGGILTWQTRLIFIQILRGKVLRNLLAYVDIYVKVDLPGKQKTTDSFGVYDHTANDDVYTSVRHTCRNSVCEVD